MLRNLEADNYLQFSYHCSDACSFFYIFFLASQVCTKSVYSVALRSVISCLPAWWRFAQCLRRYRDTKMAFPHLVNAGKYSTTFFNVLFSTLYKVETGKYCMLHVFKLVFTIIHVMSINTVLVQ